MKILSTVLLGFLLLSLNAKKEQKHPSESSAYTPASILSVDSSHQNHHQDAQPFDFHWSSLAAIILLPAVALVIFIYMRDRKPYILRNKIDTAPYFAMVIFYFIYIYICIEVDSTFEHITNAVPFSHYGQVQRRIVGKPPHFLFQIRCYHKSLNKKEIVIHTASQEYYPAKWRDESPGAFDLYVSKSYVFVEYNISHYFGTKKAEENYLRAQRNFIQSNTQDIRQDFQTTFVIPTLDRRVMYLAPDTRKPSKKLFWLFTIFGLHYPYVMFFELSVVRYQQNIVTNILK